MKAKWAGAFAAARDKNDFASLQILLYRALG
jgi:hypothetical protein